MAPENNAPIGGVAWVLIMMGISLAVMNWQSYTVAMQRMADMESAIQNRLASMEQQANRRTEVMLLQLNTLKRRDEIVEERSDSLAEMLGMLRERQGRLEDRLTTLEKKRGVGGSGNESYRERLGI